MATRADVVVISLAVTAFVLLVIALLPNSPLAPRSPGASVASGSADSLAAVEWKRRSTSEITMTNPGDYGTKLVHAWNELSAVPALEQPMAQQQWMAHRVDEAINEALGKVGYQARTRLLADGMFYVIEKKR